MRLLPSARLISHKYYTWRKSERYIATTAAISRINNPEKTGAWVQANPRVCLHDVHTELKAGGLPPNSPVTLTASLINENGKHFTSNGHFLTDRNGRVDLEEATSLGGSYKGVFPAGLLTSLSSVSSEQRSYRLFRRNTEEPWKVTVSVADGHVNLQSKHNTLATVELERYLMAPGTIRLPVRHGRVRGTLYIPNGPGPFPGIVDIFGFVGGLFEFRSAMMASRGFASLALAVFNYEDLPKAPNKLDFEYFEEAVHLLLSQPEVIPDRCGVVANSKSGDIGFNMAILFEQVKAVLGINALTFPMHTHYSYRGKLYAKGINISPELMTTDKQGFTYGDLTPYFNNDLPEMIPVEQADDDTHFLVVCGEDDPFGFKSSIPVFQERMQRNNRKNYETVLYPGAGHLLHPPYDALTTSGFQKLVPTTKTLGDSEGATMKWGGTPQATCHAQVDLWKRMQTFFMRHVRDESQWFQNHLQNIR